jgi:hypothetical protein
MNKKTTTQRLILDGGKEKYTIIDVDGVSFHVKSRFYGTGRLSNLLLAAVTSDIKKNPQKPNFEGSEEGELCYNHIGS